MNIIKDFESFLKMKRITIKKIIFETETVKKIEVKMIIIIKIKAYRVTDDLSCFNTLTNTCKTSICHLL